MADIGQELRLGAIGRLGLGLGLQQSRVGGHALGDITTDPDHAHNDAVLVNRLGAGLQPQRAAAPVQNARGDHLRPGLADQHPVEGFRHLPCAIGMDDINDPHSHHFVSAVAEDAQRGGGDVLINSGQIDAGDDVGNVLRQNSVLVQAVVQAPAGLLGGRGIQGAARDEDHR